MSLWIPDQAGGRGRHEQDQAEVAAQIIDAERDKIAHYEKELRQIDEHLRLVVAKPNAQHEALKPNYYHVIRLNPGHPADVLVVEHEDGSWRDLDSSFFDYVAENDLWNDRAQKHRAERNHKLHEARERQLQRESADRAAEFDERWKQRNTTTIHVPRSI